MNERQNIFSSTFYKDYFRRAKIIRNEKKNSGKHNMCKYVNMVVLFCKKSVEMSYTSKIISHNPKKLIKNNRNIYMTQG